MRQHAAADTMRGNWASLSIHGLFPGDLKRDASRQAGPAGRNVWVVVEGAEHLGRCEAGGGRGPQSGGPAQLHSPGPGPTAAGGERKGGCGDEANREGWCAEKWLRWICGCPGVWIFVDWCTENYPICVHMHAFVFFPCPPIQPIYIFRLLTSSRTMMLLWQNTV